MTEKASLEDLIKALSAAMESLAEEQNHLQAAQKDLSRARSRETDALNRVNRWQSEFDGLVKDIQKVAPPGTTWTAYLNPFTQTARIGRPERAVVNFGVNSD
jgi:hypothetical protein